MSTFKLNKAIPEHRAYEPSNVKHRPSDNKPSRFASYNNKDIPRQPFLDMNPATKVPLNTGTDQRSFSTKSEFKGQIGATAGKEGNLPPSGRTIAGYQKTGNGAFKTVNMEWGRMQQHHRVVGKIIKPSNHPNKDINKYYNGV